jgi:ribosome-associated translation inhibitor RaiA
MHVEINGDNHIHAGEPLRSEVRATVEGALDRFAERVTRVEVHLGDVNSHKNTADDKRCMMEARLKGLPPVVVTHHADSLALAIQGAAEKLERAIGNTLGRLNDR